MKKLAGVAELADALDLGSSVPDVKLQVLSPAPLKQAPFGVPVLMRINQKGLEHQGGTSRMLIILAIHQRLFQILLQEL